MKKVLDQLDIEIEKKRQELNIAANNKGYLHEETVKISMELDQFILKYQNLLIKVD